MNTYKNNANKSWEKFTSLNQGGGKRDLGTRLAQSMRPSHAR